MSNDPKDRRRYPRLPCNGSLPGVLRIKDGREITCKSVDVSKFGIGIMTDIDIELHTPLELCCGDEIITLSPVVKRRDTHLANAWQIGILVSDDHIDLERVFDKAGCIEEEVGDRRGREYVDRSTRFIPQRTLEFTACLLGTRYKYTFRVENISRTGMLLSRPSEEQAPFQVNTLLEMEIDIQGDFVKSPVICMGKVVRILEETTGDGKKLLFYGIMISDMGEHQSILDRLIQSIEDELADV